MSTVSVLHDGTAAARGRLARLHADERWAPLLTGAFVYALPATDLDRCPPPGGRDHLAAVRLLPAVPGPWLLTLGSVAAAVTHPGKLSWIEAAPWTGADVAPGADGPAALLADACASAHLVAWGAPGSRTPEDAFEDFARRAHAILLGGAGR